jgi:hypothetical protein
MKIEFVPYELALRMRNIGFNEPCFVWADIYTKENVYMYPTNENNMNQYDETVSIPLFQQAFRWFREKYDWTIKVNQVSKNNCSYTLSNFPNDKKYYGELCQTYEEAEIACLEKLIEIVELKSKDEREE